LCGERNMFVRIMRKNRIDGREVKPGDVIEVPDGIGNHLLRIGHAEALADVKETNFEPPKPETKPEPQSTSKGLPTGDLLRERAWVLEKL